MSVAGTEAKSQRTLGASPSPDRLQLMSSVPSLESVNLFMMHVFGRDTIYYHIRSVCISEPYT